MCYRCGRPGHVKDECRAKLGKGVTWAKPGLDGAEKKEFRHKTVHTSAQDAEADAIAETLPLSSGASLTATGVDGLLTRLAMRVLGEGFTGSVSCVMLGHDGAKYPVLRSGKLQWKINGTTAGTSEIVQVKGGTWDWKAFKAWITAPSALQRGVCGSWCKLQVAYPTAVSAVSVQEPRKGDRCFTWAACPSIILHTVVSQVDDPLHGRVDIDADGRRCILGVPLDLAARMPGDLKENIMVLRSRASIGMASRYAPDDVVLAPKGSFEKFRDLGNHVFLLYAGDPLSAFRYAPMMDQAQRTMLEEACPEDYQLLGAMSAAQRATRITGDINLPMLRSATGQAVPWGTPVTFGTSIELVVVMVQGNAVPSGSSGISISQLCVTMPGRIDSKTLGVAYRVALRRVATKQANRMGAEWAAMQAPLLNKLGIPTDVTAQMFSPHDETATSQWAKDITAGMVVFPIILDPTRTGGAKPLLTALSRAITTRIGDAVA